MAVQSGVLVCPNADCDKSRVYGAYVYETDEVYAYLSFTNASDDRAEPTFESAFSYLNLEIRFPAFDTNEGGRVITHTANISLEPIRELDLKQSGTSLEFTVSGTFNELTQYIRDSKDEDCITGDIVGMCYETVELDATIPYEISFSLQVPSN